MNRFQCTGLVFARCKLGIYLYLNYVVARAELRKRTRSGRLSVAMMYLKETVMPRSVLSFRQMENIHRYKKFYIRFTFRAKSCTETEQIDLTAGAKKGQLRYKQKSLLQISKILYMNCVL